MQVADRSAIAIRSANDAVAIGADAPAPASRAGVRAPEATTTAAAQSVLGAQGVSHAPSHRPPRQDGSKEAPASTGPHRSSLDTDAHVAPGTASRVVDVDGQRVRQRTRTEQTADGTKVVTLSSELVDTENASATERKTVRSAPDGSIKVELDTVTSTKDPESGATVSNTDEMSQVVDAAGTTTAYRRVQTRSVEHEDGSSVVTRREERLYFDEKTKAPQISVTERTTITSPKNDDGEVATDMTVRRGHQAYRPGMDTPITWESFEQDQQVAYADGARAHRTTVFDRSEIAADGTPKPGRIGTVTVDDDTRGVLDRIDLDHALSGFMSSSLMGKLLPKDADGTIDWSPYTKLVEEAYRVTDENGEFSWGNALRLAATGPIGNIAIRPDADGNYDWGSIATTGVSLAGTALLFTPAAPIGMGMIVASSAYSLGRDIGEIFKDPGNPWNWIDASFDAIGTFGATGSLVGSVTSGVATGWSAAVTEVRPIGVSGLFWSSAGTRTLSVVGKAPIDVTKVATGDDDGLTGTINVVSDVIGGNSDSGSPRRAPAPDGAGHPSRLPSSNDRRDASPQVEALLRALHAQHHSVDAA